MVNNHTYHSKRPSDDRLRSAWAFYFENFFNVSAGTWTEIVVINERCRSEVGSTVVTNQDNQKKTSKRVFLLSKTLRTYW